MLLGLGTAAIGRPQYINIRQQQSTAPFYLEKFKAKGKDVLETAYQKGVRYFDTAPGYGLAEQLLLDWVRGKADKSIEIATKWGYTYIANFDANATQHEVKEHSLSKLNEQWAVSQQLMPFLSTYQIHSATLDTGVLDNPAILERLAYLKSEFNLLIGITTSGTNQTIILRKALAIEIAGQPLFDVFQVTYNLFDQSLAELSEDISATDRRIVVKEALANGRVFPNKKFPHYRMVYQNLETLAYKYKVGIDAIALRFCMDSLMPFKVLSGAAEMGHLSENLKANDFQLSKQDLLALKKLQITPKKYWTERKQLRWN